MFKLNFEITASNGSELTYALAELARALGGERITSAAVVTGEKPTATLSVEPGDAPATTRTRTKKAAPAPEASETGDNIPATSDVDATAPATAPAPATSLATVSDMDPAEARSEAIKLLQDHFSKNPNSMGAIKQLQTKYGVQLFTEIKDEQAASFLTDAKLVQAGTFG